MANPIEYFYAEWRNVEDRIPPYMRAAVVGYVVNGSHVGDFLRSVLANQFHEAVKRADTMNRACLPAWADVLALVPHASWGNDAKVTAWIQGGGLIERMNAGAPDGK